MSAPRLSVREVELFERPVRLRIPFRFGVVTLTEAPQAFLRARIRLADGREGWGQAAELMVPKWFDKDPALTNGQNFDQLRASLRLARDAYMAGGPATPFGLHASLDRPIHEKAAARGLNGLVAGFGAALMDRAVIDALGRLEEAPAAALMRANALGVTSATAPDLADFGLAAFLGGLRPAAGIAYRHTVGLIDPLADADIAEDAVVGDGLPQSLQAVLERYGPRYLKLKVGGDLEADIERLGRIAAVADASGIDYRVTLDGNEQYADAAAVTELVRAIRAAPGLERLSAAILYLEQPVARAGALERPIHDLAALVPVAVDESDADIGVFPRARALGYAGMSSKSCKGLYRSLLNAARCAMWNAQAEGAPHFMTAEDLTTQAGIAVQQDLVLASLIGCRHVERNGHHYVDGFGAAPEAEQEAFLAAHPDLYARSGGRVRLSISKGEIALGSLDCPGLGAAAEPDWSSMARMP